MTRNPPTETRTGLAPAKPAVLHLTGAQALVRVLRAEGVDTVFGIVGGKLSPLFHALSREPGIRFIGVRHEAAGPMMAAAVFASASGRLSPRNRRARKSAAVTSPQPFRTTGTSGVSTAQAPSGPRTWRSSLPAP